jgi:competence protein ComFC
MCDRCLSKIVPVGQPICARCGQSLGDAAACRHCSRRAPAFDAARSLGAYDGVLKHAIHLLKYRDRPALAQPLGTALTGHARSEADSLAHLRFDVIVPVPMHPVRERLRGYNQAERVARVLARDLGIRTDSTILRRSRNTRPQVGLAQDARQNNLRDAFVAHGAVDGACVLIVDDVSTTTSSLHECAKALKNAGATSVYALTLAAG